MPKVDDDDIVKHEDSLSWYLVPTKDNLSSFAQTIDSTVNKNKEDRFTFSGSMINQGKLRRN